MIKIVWKALLILSAGLILGMVGMLIGALIGGNFATSFQFNSVRGYEATGQVGFIIGTSLGVFVSWKRFKNKWKNTDT